MVRVDAKNNVYITLHDDAILEPKVYYADRSATYKITEKDHLYLTIFDEKNKNKKTFDTMGGKIVLGKRDLEQFGIGKFNYEIKLFVNNSATMHTIITTYDKKFNPHLYICEDLFM